MRCLADQELFFAWCNGRVLDLFKCLRRACRFSLRTLLIATGLVSVIAFFVGRPIRDYQINQSMKQHIGKLGGRFTEEPRAGGILVWCFPDAARQIVRVDLGNRHVTTQDLQRVAQLPQLTALLLYYSDVDDAGVKELLQCRHLETLDLDGTRVTDSGLAEVSRIKTLKWLGLRNTRITDVGIRHLRSLAQLEEVFLWKTAVTESGADNLRAARPQATISRFPLDATPKSIMR